jgi:hypothetical protein
LNRYFKVFLRKVNDLITSIRLNLTLFKISENLLQTGKSKSVISFCLFGQDPNYLNQVDNCIKSYQYYFTDWLIRIYVAKDIPAEIISKITASNCELIIMDSIGFNYCYTFWRFMVVDDTTVERAVIRDIDSRASLREKIMVDQWLSSGSKLHVIRDHPYHEEFIMAGMWGLITNGVSEGLVRKIKRFVKTNSYGIDQAFLKKIYRRYANRMFVHDVLKRFPGESPVIIAHDPDAVYIGEVTFPHENKQHYRDVIQSLYLNTAVKKK